MAEAAVEERTPSKFYCHMCNVQFENASTNYTCPHCSNGFIEELNVSSGNDDEYADVADSDDDNYQFNYSPLRVFPVGVGDNRRARYTIDQTLRRNLGANNRNQIPFADLIQEFVVNLGVGVNLAGAGGNMVFLGNPGDYAWGREGLDAIVSQLLNQMDTSGPPPVSKDIIDALPTVEITQGQVNTKLQCSVCWEDFQLDEKVRQLPCQHVYHEPCIRPWLELHGTCPICRQNLLTGEQQSFQEENHANAGNYNAFQQLFHAVQQNSSMGANNTTTNASSNNPSDTTASSSSSFRRSDSPM